MCGLVGIYLREAPCDLTIVERMRDLVTYRGPDDAGSFVAGPLGLGHRRLSIIDLGGGHQPMATPDGRWTIVFNGEIYNYRELRRELEGVGVTFRTQSDTEVILQLHARDGDAAAARLNGIFAYALWDASERRLLLVRDRAGVKPLYYAATNGGVAFGSEIKTLFASGLLEARMDRTRVAEYMVFRHVAGRDSLFEGVQSVPPGYIVQIAAGHAAEPRAFWNAEARPQAFVGSFHEAVDALDMTLNAAIERQMIADVPLGTFCSGGIDSSLVTAIAARKAPRSINTYSVGFDDSSYDESAFARRASSSCGTVHHELRVSEAEFVDNLPRLVWHHDLPLNFANSVHIHAVSELARRDVTVVLTGEGADELFGGYPRYYIPRLLAPLAVLGPGARGALGRLLGRFPDHRLRKLGAFAQRAPKEWLLFNSATSDPSSVVTLLGGRKLPPFTFRSDRLESAIAHAPDLVTALAMLDFETYLVSILDRQDKMSMATSIESRVPFLDNEVIDLARSLPLAYRQTLRYRKRVLKEVALRYLPTTIVHRKKSGFGVPLPTWFAGRGPASRLLDEAASSPRLLEALDGAALRRLVQEHRRGGADHGDLLWSAVNLHVWQQVFEV